MSANWNWSWSVKPFKLYPSKTNWAVKYISGWIEAAETLFLAQNPTLKTLDSESIYWLDLRVSSACGETELFLAAAVTPCPFAYEDLPSSDDNGCCQEDRKFLCLFHLSLFFSFLIF